MALLNPLRARWRLAPRGVLWLVEAAVPRRTPIGSKRVATAGVWLLSPPDWPAALGGGERGVCGGAVEGAGTGRERDGRGGGGGSTGGSRFRPAGSAAPRQALGRGCHRPLPEEGAGRAPAVPGGRRGRWGQAPSLGAAPRRCPAGAGEDPVLPGPDLRYPLRVREAALEGAGVPFLAREGRWRIAPSPTGHTVGPVLRCEWGSGYKELRGGCFWFLLGKSWRKRWGFKSFFVCKLKFGT